MGLFENIRKEKVQRLNIREPATVGPGDSVREAILRMREAQLGCAIVVDEENKPVGIFTESILTQVIKDSPQSLKDPVERHMADQVPWVKLTDPIAMVLEAMELKNTRFLCVLDEEGRLTGLTGQKGLMEYVADHFPGEVMVQRIGCKPYMHTREGA